MPVTQRDVVDETFANCGLEGSKSNQVQVSGIGVNGVNRTVSNENSRHIGRRRIETI
jgi:hypothetical protein